MAIEMIDKISSMRKTLKNRSNYCSIAAMFPKNSLAMCDLGIDMVARFKKDVNIYKLFEQITENCRGRSKNVVK